MVIYKRLTNILLSNVAPAPNAVKYWADLKTDPSGKTIKTYTGGKWVNINGSSSSSEIETTEELINTVEDLKTENTQLKNTVSELTNLVAEQSSQIEVLNNEVVALHDRIDIVDAEIDVEEV